MGAEIWFEISAASAPPANSAITSTLNVRGELKDEGEDWPIALIRGVDDLERGSGTYYFP